MPIETSWPISVSGAEPLQRAGAVQGQHGAGEERRSASRWAATDADQVGLLHHVGDIEGRRNRLASDWPASRE